MDNQLIPAGYKQTEVGVIPEDWDVCSIGELCNISVGKDLDTTYSTQRDSIFRYPVFSNTVDNPGIYGYYNYPEYSGDVVTVVGRGVGLGTAIRRTGGFGAIGRLIVLFPRKDVSSGYLANYINQKIDIHSESSGVPQLTGVAFSGYKVAVPLSIEQTAIANALSDVDALIAALEKLINKKSAIKTAAMQQLLTGKKRLPPFDQLNTGYKQTELGEIPGDWEVASLGEIGETIIGLTYSPNDVSDFGTLVLRSSNVQNNRLTFDNNVFVNMVLPDRVIVREADVLVCVRNGSRQLIGKCALIDAKTAGCAFGAFMSIYRSKNSQFVFYQFQSNIIQDQINEVMGATINQITNKDMASFRIPLPRDEKEQTAIANVLSDIDKEIEALQQRLHKTQQIKQGMMQELLTGKTRLVK